MSYCIKCKQKTESNDVQHVMSKNNTSSGRGARPRPMLKGICVQCGCKNCQFVKGGALNIHSLIGKLPRPKGGFTLLNHQYTCPYNPLDTQLDENDTRLPGQKPYNQVDEIAMHHDVCYRDSPSSKGTCDRKMLDDLSEMKPYNL